MMSYYLLPKKNNIIQINPHVSHVPLQPILSPSLVFYLNDTFSTFYSLLKHIDEEERTNILKILNPYEFLYCKINDTNQFICKINVSIHIFYVFIEMMNIFNILELFFGKNMICVYYSSNHKIIMDSFHILRDQSKDLHLVGDLSNHAFHHSKIISEHDKYSDFLFYELDDAEYSNINTYNKLFLSIVCSILRNQKDQGVCIIKVDHLYHKPILDIVFLLTSLYEKIYIIKPNSSPILTNERFLICKKFIRSNQIITEYLHKIESFLDQYQVIQEEETIVSLMDFDIPYYFINKIEESNITIGHQQIEQIDQMMGIFKNKNKEDKLLSMKKANIQKCFLWCEKNRIPYNKFLENTSKTNIFF